MRRLLLYIIIGVMSALPAQAQDEPEYRMEIGAGVGLMNYMGDFNGSLTKQHQPMASVVARYKFNVRQCLQLNISYGKMKGSADGVATWYPDPATGENPSQRLTDYRFSNNLVDIGLRYEQNFWAYGTGFEYRGARRLAPFLAAGLGATVCQGAGVTLNLPLAVGLKYKIKPRLNLGLEWAMHFTLSDELDGRKDPYGIKSSGLFKNTDCYSRLQLSLTYEFMAKCKTCHNNDE